MKRKSIISILCCIMLLFGALCTPSAEASDKVSADAASALDGIISFKLDSGGYSSVQQWIDGELTEKAGVSSEMYIIALHQSGQIYDYSSYSAALLGFLDENSGFPAATAQKYALALKAANCPSDHPAQVLASTAQDSGIMSRVFGLHLINNGTVCDSFTAEDTVEALLGAQLADGGWALRGDTSDVDVTAMTLQALAPYAYADSNVRTAVDKALLMLSARQLESGAFAGMGKENAESTAQVIIALTSLGIDCQNDSRFIKGGTVIDGLLKFRLADGSFCHEAGGEYSHLSTSQAFCALVAIERSQRGAGAFYLLDAQPESAPASADNASAHGSDYKLWSCLAIFITGAGVCLVLWLRGRKNAKNFIAIAAAVILLCSVVLLTDIQRPEDYYSADLPSKTDIVGSVTISIRCDRAVGLSDSEHLPADGIILAETTVEISQNDTVYDILIECARRYKIQVDTASGSSYVRGIGYLYEFDYGDLSGWVYHVNGESPSVGCGEYVLADGDRIEWLYSLELGNDL